MQYVWGFERLGVVISGLFFLDGEMSRYRLHSVSRP
jgi:hypothetical protein